MNIVLFGMKGVGKTTLGKRLAKALKLPFLDTDRLIESLYFTHWQEKLPCSNIYQKIGALAFRSLERAALRSLNSAQNSIIAVGGGAFLFPKNVSLLKRQNHFIYLTCNATCLKKRLLSQKILPHFIDPLAPELSFDKVYGERTHVYQKVQSQRIDVTSLKNFQLVLRVKNDR